MKIEPGGGLWYQRHLEPGGPECGKGWVSFLTLNNHIRLLKIALIKERNNANEEGLTKSQSSDSSAPRNLASIGATYSAVTQ